MRRNSTAETVGIVVLLVVLLIGVGALAIRPGTTTTTVDTRPPVVLPDDGSPVVHTLRTSGGLSVFGLQITDPTYTVEVQFLAGPDCAPAVSPGDAWPTSLDECTHPSELVGEVASLGRMSSGESIVGVAFSTSRKCYDSLERGSAWPPIAPECG